MTRTVEEGEYFEIFKNGVTLRDTLREFNGLKLEDENPIFNLECHAENIKSWLAQYIPVDLNLR